MLVNFSQIAQLDVQAYQVSLAIAVMRVVATLLTSWVCNRYGKRGPALFFGSVTAVSIGVLAATVYPFFTLPYWMITTVVLVYVLSCCVCFSSIPWSMLGEIFPTNVRGIANGLTTSIAFIESVFMVKLYPEAVLSFGAFPVFSFFSVCSLLGTVFLYYFLPETHGKTLKEIEEYFTVRHLLASIDNPSGVIIVNIYEQGTKQNEYRNIKHDTSRPAEDRTVQLTLGDSSSRCIVGWQGARCYNGVLF
ncbi:hypothetical protein J6590_044285 [Homalodisca vitripennis]|nr:hypothetical protein J6590_044285 [Homalodisca vitripennis]